MKGWDIPTNSLGSTTWSHGHLASVPGNHHESAFQVQAAHHITDNPFQQTQQHQQTYSNNQVSDDSLMVDNMFASLVTPEIDGDGLLVGLNSVSLGGVSSHQGENWGSKITDWTGDEARSLLPHSRLGEYREER